MSELVLFLAQAGTSNHAATFWVELIVHAGVLGAIAIFLIKHVAERDKKAAAEAQEREKLHTEIMKQITSATADREKRMADRISKLEQDNSEISRMVQDKLVELVDRTSAVQTENTTVMRELATLAKEQYIEIKALREVLMVRPCFSEEARERILEMVEVEMQKLVTAIDARNGKKGA